MSNANIVMVDWAALSLGERIRYVEVVNPKFAAGWYASEPARA